jgi:hypothetical protein
MKRKITFILTLFIGFCTNLSAQFNFIDPIKTPVNYPETVFEQLFIGYPSIRTQIPDGADWLDSSKITLPTNAQGDLLSYGQYTWNTTTSNWDDLEMRIDFTYTYDGSDKMTSYSRIIYDAGAVLMTRNTTSMIYNGTKIQVVYYNDVFGASTMPGRDTFIYNGNKLIEKNTAYTFMGTFSPQGRYLYTYSGPNVTEELYQEYSSGAWEDNEKSTFTYDGQDRMITFLKESFDGTAWSNDENSVYSYGTNGKVSIYERHSDWSGSTYTDNQKSFYNYDGSGKLISGDEQEYISGAWVNDNHSEVTYNGATPVEAYSYDWNGTAYSTVAYEKTIWSEGNPNLPPAAPTNLALEPLRALETMRLTWTDNASDETGFKIERSTDGTNFTEIADLTTANTITYDDTDLPEATTYHYRVLAYNANGNSSFSNVAQGTTGSAGLNTVNSVEINVYPNPTSIFLTVELENESSFKIVSLLGETINYGSLNKGINKLDVSTLSNGNYIFKIESSEGVTFKTITVNK